MNMIWKKVLVSALGVIIAGLCIFSTASADTIGDCVLTGYTYMAGGGAYVTRSAADEKDYMIASPLAYMYDLGNGPTDMWGYGWMKFDNLSSETVDSAYLAVTLLGVGGMGSQPATADYPGELDIYSPGDTDVATLSGYEAGLANIGTLHDYLTGSNASPLYDTLVMDENGTYCIDITDLYNGWVTGEIANNGIVVASNSENRFASQSPGCVGVHLTSFGNENGGAPYITTSPVPVPAAAWLFFSGLAGVAGFRRKTGGWIQSHR